MNREEAWLLEEKYRGEKCEAFFTDLQRLQSGEPLSYIIGHTPFLNTTIYLDNLPLIPRPETEFWVEKAIIAVHDAVKKPPHVLDLCAGSGAIGVAVAKNVTDAKVTFGEVDQKLLSTIESNCAHNQIPERNYHITESNLLTDIHDTFDFILSNPPYIDPELNRTEKSVSEFEPHLALFGGRLGLELIAQIISDAPEYLNPDGQLWLEHEPEQAAAIQILAQQAELFPTTHTDQFGVARYSILMLK